MKFFPDGFVSRETRKIFIYQLTVLLAANHWPLAASHSQFLILTAKY